MDRIGKYKVIKELGAGGFGAVYLAEDPRLGTQVAIKVFQVKDSNLAGMATSATSDASTVLTARFLSEARTLESLSHNPFIVNLKEFDELEDGTPYYVMPYLPQSLENEIGKDAFTKGKLEETPKSLHPRKLASSRALAIVEQILEGMSAVHQAGLVHRDIKPANILFDSQGTVQICDFGIAKLPDADHSQSGVGMGSRNYMSPEQRESAKHVLPSSDVYSIGILTYRMLTGQLPLGRFQDAISYAPEIGQAVNDLIDQAISQDESERPKDAAAFLLQFKRALKDSDEAPSEDEYTGTWVDEDNTANIKAELKPLEQEIISLLQSQGEVNYTDMPVLHAFAEIGNLSQNELLALIDQIKNQQESDNPQQKAFQQWVIKLNARQATKQTTSPSEREALLEVAMAATSKSENTLREILENKLPLAVRKTISSTKSADTSSDDDASKSNTTNQQNATSKQKAAPEFDKKPAGPVLQRKKGIIASVVMLCIITVSVYSYWSHQESEKVAAAQAFQQQVASDKREAEDNWQSALSANTRKAYADYVDAWPRGEHIEQARQRIKQFESDEQGATRHARFYIDASPSDARVRILNIQTTYQYGMSLDSGRYQVEVSKAGYTTATQWFDLSNTNNRLSATLNKVAISGGQTHRIGNTSFKMNEIPSGSFMMGCSADDSECFKYEKPRHRVSINAFTLMESEVTWVMYQPCIDAGACPNNDSDGGDSNWGKDNRPVIEVSYDDIIKHYIPWLNKTTAQTFRLPSEAEWEYAARGGTTTKYSWGNAINCDQARYGRRKNGECSNSLDGTVPIKSFLANSYGLYDMHGNVYEWTADCWNESYAGAPNDGRAWTQGDCSRRAVRGGSWNPDPRYLRASYRLGGGATNRRYSIGFRLAQD